MASYDLTNDLIDQALKADAPRTELFDREVGGLGIRVSGNSAIWFFRYRDGAGKQPRARIGYYAREGGVDVAAARSAAIRIRSANDARRLEAILSR